MKKSALKQLSVPMLPLHKNDAIFRAQPVKLIARAKKAQYGKLLIVTLFDREMVANGDDRPKFILYLSATDYLTRVISDGKYKWSIGDINSITTYMEFENTVFYLEKEEQTVAQFSPLKKHIGLPFNSVVHNALDRISQYQTHIRHQRLMKRHEKLIAELDERMSTVPKIPKGFNIWVDLVPLKSSRYVYYKRISKKKAEGFCTHCKQDFILTEKPIHNASGTCPQCKCKIKYKSIGKSQHVEDSCYATLLQRTSANQLVLRTFHINRSFSSDYRKPVTRTFEYCRMFFTLKGERIDAFKWKQFKNTGVLRWCEATQRDLSYYFAWTFNRYHGYPESHLYTRTLSQNIKGTFLEYSLLKVYAQHGAALINTFVEWFEEYAFIEYLLKLRLPGIVDYALQVSDADCRKMLNLNGKGFAQILKVPLSKLPQMRRVHADGAVLEVLQKCPKELSDEELIWLAGNKSSGDLITHIMKYTTLHQVKKYIDKYKISKNGIKNWVDYLEVSNVLGYNMKSDFVLFPKNLHEAHDAAMELLEVDPLIYDKAIKNRYPALRQSYAYSYGAYLITPPRNAAEMVAEGEKLHHCVARNYMRSMALGLTDILFIRKKDNPAIPFYTLELKNKQVQQCMGLQHCECTDEINAFIDRWKLRVVAKAATEERNRLNTAA